MISLENNSPLRINFVFIFNWNKSSILFILLTFMIELFFKSIKELLYDLYALLFTKLFLNKFILLEIEIICWVLFNIWKVLLYRAILGSLWVLLSSFVFKFLGLAVKFDWVFTFLYFLFWLILFFSFLSISLSSKLSFLLLLLLFSLMFLFISISSIVLSFCELQHIMLKRTPFPIDVLLLNY